MPEQATKKPEPKSKRKKYRLKLGRFKLIGVLAAITYVLIAIVNQQSTYSAQLTERVRLKNENAALERQLEYYKNAADYIGSDEYVEQQARMRLGWLKPNEVKYVAGSEDTTFHAPSSEEASTTTIEPQQSVQSAGTSTSSPEPTQAAPDSAEEPPAQSP